MLKHLKSESYISWVHLILRLGIGLAEIETIVKNNLVMAVVMVAITGFSVCVQASSITGMISFEGLATVNTGDLGTATAFTCIYDVTVNPGATGTYSPITSGTAVSFSTFGFADNELTPDPAALWTVCFGGDVYAFTATSVLIDRQGDSPGLGEFLDLSGTGIAYLNGEDATDGSWTITDFEGAHDPVFTFAVPDGGRTSAFLGFGAGCCALFGGSRLLRFSSRQSRNS